MNNLKIPQHIAIIMDGNGRWATARKLARTAGHKEGIKRVKDIVRAAKKLGVKILTLFAFSTENWNRPKSEINLLFSYLNNFLKTYKKELMKENIKLKVIGRRDRISENIIKKIEELEKLTATNNDFLLNIALDYGGRWDIVNATKKIISDIQQNKISVDMIDENFFSRYLSINDLPDPDLLIRTSGEERISNFLLWNLAYSELYFPKVYWPDFDEKQLKKAIEVYSKRERRYGAISIKK
ncbi:MAG: isoprenyl transferase [Candidatus Omnitrophica bacterium]|nr:isoprenyl transferase [Candidatus Omnitrophota bacterium]MCM8831272.1 isoprenyl transferase [Candidatus Omnitrophota bacterium]